MPPKNCAKKGLAENSAPWRDDQRRLRNRLSQKAARERKAARIQQLERQLAAVTNGGEGARVNELLSTNSRLRHALLDTRKKLASLSTTAAQLGDWIKVVLDDNEAEQHSDDAADPMDLFNDDPYLWKDDPPTCTQSPPTSSAESTMGSQEREPVHDIEVDVIIPPASAEAESADTTAMSAQTITTLAPTDAVAIHDSQSEAMSILLPKPYLLPALNVYSGSTLSEHLECIHRLIRLGDALKGGSSMPQVIGVMMSALLEYAWPSMKHWFSTTQSFPLGCKVLWWQTSSSDEAATQVPVGNAPTLIQLSRPSYPCILDWVPHPGLRDNLILNYQSYDVDQVICDMSNAFVVEIEESRLAIDELYSGLFQNSRCKGYCYSLMELVERTSTFGPINVQSHQELTAMRLLQSTDSRHHTTADHPIHRFKLDPSFFDKYPALYDANAESKYRPKTSSFVQKARLPLPFTMESVNDYMNVVLQAKINLGAS